jgi:hypothetical protein
MDANCPIMQAKEAEAAENNGYREQVEELEEERRSTLLQCAESDREVTKLEVRHLTSI